MTTRDADGPSNTQSRYPSRWLIAGHPGPILGRGGDDDRAADLLDAPCVTKRCPGGAPPREGQRGLGKAEVGGEGEGPVGIPDGVEQAGRLGRHGRARGQQGDELRRRPERLEEGNRLDGKGERARVPEIAHHPAKLVHRQPGGREVAPVRNRVTASSSAAAASA